MMRIKFLAASIILVLPLVLGAGCELLPDIVTQPSPSSPPATGGETIPIDEDWELAPAESQAQALPSIADVVAKVKPSVVTVNVVAPDVFGQPREGGGSGWIISEDGIIITNNHVVEGAETITVALDDGRTFPVDINVVATDYLADLAVLKIEAENLTPITVGDSDKLKVGDWVVAIGNALGRGLSATTGIVSRKGVEIMVGAGQTMDKLIQTDAAINPGNSGGPLVNMAGEVIGINTIKIAEVTVEGVGLAISSNKAMPIIQQLISNGYVVRPYLGVGAQTVNPTLVFWNDLAVEEGAFISNVGAGSPADKAGIRAEDVIIEFGGKVITNVNELIQAIHSAQVGQEVEIVFWREDVEHTVKAILSESPPPP